MGASEPLDVGDVHGYRAVADEIKKVGVVIED